MDDLFITQCWTHNFGNNFASLLQFWGKIPSKVKVCGRRRKVRDHTTKVYPGGKCTYIRINMIEEK